MDTEPTKVLLSRPVCSKRFEQTEAARDATCLQWMVLKKL